MLWALLITLVAMGQEPTLGEFGSRDMVPVEGSPWRLATRPGKGTPPLAVLADAKACASAIPADLANAEKERDACLPRFDRSGSFRVAVQLKDTARALPVVLDNKRLRVILDTTPGEMGGEQVVAPSLVDVTGHYEGPARQLVVLVLDRSGSMFSRDGGARIRALLDALAEPKVVNTFFPASAAGEMVNQSRVAIASVGCNRDPRGVCGISAKGEVPLAEMPVLATVKEYEAALREVGRATRAYTPLYEGVREVYGVIRLPRAGEELTSDLQEFLGRGGVEPTVIVLSDGFNNTKGSQLCNDNVAELEALVRDLGIWRRRRRAWATLNTIGFGQSLLDSVSNEQALARRGSIDGFFLCGPRLYDQISGGVDAYLDNRSLTMMAAVGGGHYAHAADASGLVKALAAQRPTSYHWYEVSVDELPLAARRRPFDVRFEVEGAFRASALLRAYPHPFLGASPGSDSLGDLLRLPLIWVAGVILLLFGFRAVPMARRSITRQPSDTLRRSGDSA